MTRTARTTCAHEHRGREEGIAHETPITLWTDSSTSSSGMLDRPPGILHSEILPKARRDPSYLERNGGVEMIASGADDAAALAHDAREPRQSEDRQALHTSEASGFLGLGPAQVRLTELSQRVHAPHARAGAVRPLEA